jgi:hypothetical protein
MHRPRSKTLTAIAAGLAAALALAATPAGADHYPDVKRSVARRDNAVLEGLARLTFAESYSMTIDAGYCDCLEPECDGGFMTSCGGEVIPFYNGSLSAVRRTSRATCLVCGCAGLTPIELRATPVCLGF